MQSVQVLLGRAWRNLNRRISRLYLDRMARPNNLKLIRLGSRENGWFGFEMPPASRCYCIGVGRDATFDFALAKLGADVYSFDPTPLAVDYMEMENRGRVQFHPWGVFDYDGVIKFFKPFSDMHGSYFVNDLHRTGKYFELPCYRLATIMKMLGHCDVYMIKMDIEGSWFQCIDDMIKSAIYPKVLQLEFDSPAPVWRVAKTHRSLEKSGYSLVHREGDNVVYLRQVA